MKAPEYNKNEGMSSIVKTAGKTMLGPILLYGIYLCVYSHTLPGGGFSAGLIIALGYTLFLLAFGKDETAKLLSKPAMSFLENLGAIILLSASLLAFLGGYFILKYFSKTLSAAIAEITITILEVSLGLLAVFIALALLKYKPDGIEKDVKKEG